MPVAIGDSSDDEASAESITRLVDLHTLEAGALRVKVKDLFCTTCGTLNYFDGRTCGAFSLSSTVIYSREILDLRTYQVCGIGASFCEAYETTNAMKLSVTSQFRRAALPEKCHRR